MSIIDNAKYIELGKKAEEAEKLKQLLDKVKPVIETEAINKYAPVIENNTLKRIVPIIKQKYENDLFSILSNSITKDK